MRISDWSSDVCSSDLVDNGLAESRARAQALILAGLVFLGDRKIDKAGQQVAADAELEVKGRDHPWVSRGGIKLAHALEHFEIDVTGAVAIDVGSSTDRNSVVEGKSVYVRVNLGGG